MTSTVEPLAEIDVDPERARVYELGWQSWSPTTTYRLDQRPFRAPNEHHRALNYRSQVPAPDDAFQGEGLLAIDPGDGGPVLVVAAADGRAVVPSIRAERRGSTLVVAADGPVEQREERGDLQRALARWAEAYAARTGAPTVRPAPVFWSSWYHYFTTVTEADVLENLDAMDELELPIAVVQLDDGYQTEIGDWLSLSHRFDSLPDLVDRIRQRGRGTGIWTAPFLVGERSQVAAQHPDWLVGGRGGPLVAGRNWEQDCYVLDVTHPAAAEWLQEVFRTLTGWGIGLHKIDFVYGGALEGRRHEDVSGIAAYRRGLALIREAIGPDSYLLGCGAPILPSVGLVDALRVGPDTGPEHEPLLGDMSQPSSKAAMLTSAARAFTARALLGGRPRLPDRAARGRGARGLGRAHRALRRRPGQQRPAAVAGRLGPGDHAPAAVRDAAARPGGVLARMSRADARRVLAELQPSVAALAAKALDGDAADAFLARLDHSFPDAWVALDGVFGEDHDVTALLDGLLARVVDAAAARPADLRRLDRRREIDPDWFLHERMVGYVCYADRFAGDLQGVRQHLDYLAELGVTYLHLMPLLEPRPKPNDGGYAVASYSAVDPRLGSMDDLEALAGDLRARGMSLCVDVVVNHTAREHRWAQAALAGDPAYLGYYLTFPDRELPDAYERTLPEVFPDIAPGSFTWVEEMQRWVWTTFNAYQWDLDHSNPAVFAAMLDVLLTAGQPRRRRPAAGRGAVPVEAAGHRLPEPARGPPAAARLARAAGRGDAGRDLQGRGDRPPATSWCATSGRARSEQRECELAYHNQLMAQSWSAVATRDAALAQRALSRMARPPSSTTWVTYVRCHDDIGWAVGRGGRGGGRVGRLGPPAVPVGLLRR